MITSSLGGRRFSATRIPKSFPPSRPPPITTDPDGDVTAYGYNDLGQQTQTSQGQIESSPGPAWTFSNLAPNSLGAYDIYVYFSATPSDNSWQGDFTVTDANGNSVGIAPLAPGTDPAVTPLGTGWYLLGSVIATGAADTSLTVTDSNQSGAGFAAKAGLLEQTSSTTYDADGNVLSTTDALGNVATCAYDALGRQTQTSQGQIGAFSGNTCIFSSLTQMPGEERTYKVYVNSSTPPSGNYTVSDGESQMTFNATGSSSSTPLGTDWYYLGAVTLAAADTSSSLTVTGPTGGSAARPA